MILKLSIHLTPICSVITYLMHERTADCKFPAGFTKSPTVRGIITASQRILPAYFGQNSTLQISRGRRAGKSGSLLRRFGRRALRAGTKLRRRRRLLKARYKFGIARTSDPRKRAAAERRRADGWRSRAFMIAIMPNTISREILSADRARRHAWKTVQKIIMRCRRRTREDCGERTAERMRAE